MSRVHGIVRLDRGVRHDFSDHRVERHGGHGGASLDTFAPLVAVAVARTHDAEDLRGRVVLVVARRTVPDVGALAGVALVVSFGGVEMVVVDVDVG